MLLRYAFSSHSFLAAIIMLLGLVVYFLAEIFEKLERFNRAGSSLFLLLEYFFYRTPGMIALILPAVFFLAAIIFLCNMAKSRELTALQAGGVKPLVLLKYLLSLSIIWAIAQLFFSQYVAIEATKNADFIWLHQVKNREIKEIILDNVWFVDDEYIVHLQSLDQEGRGKNLTAYKLSENNEEVLEIVSAKSLEIKEKVWTVYDGEQSIPKSFQVEKFTSATLPIERDYTLFFIADSSTNPQNLPLQHLDTAIDELVLAGSNVESLQTAFHMKYAYAASVLALCFVAFALISWKENVYICLSIGMIIAFLFFVSIMIGQTLGESGALHPILAAWFPHCFVIFFSILRLYSVNYR